MRKEGGRPSPGPARELIFTAAAPVRLEPDELAIDLRSDFPGLLRSERLALRDTFVDWLGALNRNNASLAWWAYTSTAKNFLSSPLGDQCLAVLALDRLLEKAPARRVFVINAGPAQEQALAQRFEAAGWRVRAATRSAPALEPLLRAIWQFLRVLALWARRRLRPAAGPPPEAVIFTYVDGAFRGGPDAFFGPLAERLAKRVPPVTARYVAFVHSDYQNVLPRLTAAQYAPLFGELKLTDLLWTLRMTLSAWWRAGRVEAPPVGRIPGTPLLRAALRWDLGRGGYYYNALVYRAAKRLFSRWRPRWLIYPYENKALEKMLLLGVQEGAAACRIVGYQHTSLTRRHATMLFAEGEAAATPLPQRIVTVGEVTRRYLEQEGRYPEGIFVTGCALRQTLGAPFTRRSSDGKVRLLLALSSSRRELAEALAICRRALELEPALELGVRTHPEFPLEVLPTSERNWVERAARNFAGTPLVENLKWCDGVVYVSSTVALEALGRGRPVINLAISDFLDPDPVLDGVELHWRADDPALLAAAAREIASLPQEDFEARRARAMDYIARYLRPPTPEAIEAFVPA